jgi:hypothetical protein
MESGPATPPSAPQLSKSQKKRLRQKKAAAARKAQQQQAQSQPQAEPSAQPPSEMSGDSGKNTDSNSNSSVPSGGWVDLNAPLTKNQKKKILKKKAAERKKEAEKQASAPMSDAQLQELMDKAKSSMQLGQAGSGEDQVAGAMKALEHITQVLRQTRGGEQGVQAALDKARIAYEKTHGK